MIITAKSNRNGFKLGAFVIPALIVLCFVLFFMFGPKPFYEENNLELYYHASEPNDIVVYNYRKEQVEIKVPVSDEYKTYKVSPGERDDDYMGTRLQFNVADGKDVVLYVDGAKVTLGANER